MNTATSKKLIADHFTATQELPDPSVKSIKRLRKVKDSRGRIVRLFSIEDGEWGAAVITDPSDERVLDLVALGAGGLEEVDDVEALKDSYLVWDWEHRVGPKPEGYDNDLTPDLFYFCFVPADESSLDTPYVVVTRRDLWDSEGCLDDQETSNVVTEPYGLVDLMESIFEYEGTEAEARQRLLDAGFIENPSLKEI